MNLFEPPPHQPPLFAPSGVVKRVGFDLVLGIALGVGAACAFFALNWAGFGPSDDDPPTWLFWLFYGVFMGTVLIELGLRAIIRRWPSAAILLTTFGWLRIAAFTLFLLWLAFAINERLSQVAGKDFLTLVILAAVLGVAWFVGLVFAWQEARSRVTPWIVAAVSLYVAADWSVKLGPATNEFNDPRVTIAYMTLIGCGVYLVCAILAFMDWLIAWRNRDLEANGNG